jgi:uncharacterized protein YggE
MMENNNGQSNGASNVLPKGLVNGLGALLIIFVAMLIIQQVYSFNQLVKNQKPANTISVSGDGKVTATPDLATVNIGVTSQATTATDAKNQNDKKIQQVIDFIKSQGVDQKDIATTDYNLNPQYNYGAGTAPTITGYELDQTVTVKVHGVDKDASVMNKVIDGSVNNGANQVNGVSLSIENPDALQQQAQTLAIAAAKQKAQALAQAAGLSLGKVVSVSESNVNVPGPIPYAMDASAGMALAKSAAPDIQTGSQEIDETMTVTYEVK